MAGAAERLLIARFTAQTKELTKGIQTVNAQMQGVAKTTDQTNSRVGAAAKGMGGSLVRGVAKGAAVVGGALVAVGVAAGTVGIKTAAGMEQAKIGFTTMLGSAKKADAFLRDLQKFAAETPFEFPELQTAASSLVSAGIEAGKVIPIMKTLGDVTSGMGTGSEGVKRATVALQQMNAAGKITGEDLNQLRDAGIPVYDLLAKALGKPKAEVTELAAKGKLGKDALDKMMKALETGKGLERFQGLMQKQSQSLVGMWSTLKDAFGQGMAKAVEPILPILKTGLGTATSALAAILPSAVGLFGTLAKVAGPILEKAGPQIGEMAKAFGAIIDTGIQTVLPVLVDLVMGLLKALKPTLGIIGAVAGVLGQVLGQALKIIMPLINDLVGVIGDVLFKVILALAPVVVKLAYSFLTVLPAVVQLVQALLPLIPVALDLVLALTPILTIAAELVAAFAPLIVTVVELVASVVAQLIPAFQTLMPVVTLVATILGEGMRTASLIVIKIIQVIVQAFTWLFNMLVGHSIIPDLVKGILTWFTRLRDYGIALIQKLTALIVSAFNWLWGKVSAIAASIRDAVVGRLRQMRDWAVGAVVELRDRITGAAESARKWVTDKFTSLRDGVRDKANQARDAALGAFGAIRDKVGGIFSAAVTNIGRVWNKLEGVLKAPVSFLIDTVINKGLIGAFNWVAGKVGLKGLPAVHIAGFDQGGYTGKLGRKQVAGVVHGDEHVIRSSSRRKLESRWPGLLDYLNRHGSMPGYAGGGRVNLRGKTFTGGFAAAIQNAEKLAKTIFSLFQGGFRPATSYSGTSHAGDAVDLGPINARVVRALRASGIAAWDRTGMGNWMPHIHGVPLPGFGSPSGSAVWQAQNYLKGGNGLGGADNGQGAGYRPWPIKGGQAAFFDLPSWLGKFKDGVSFLKDKITKDFTNATGWENNWWAQTIAHTPGALMSKAPAGLGSMGTLIKDGFKEKFSFDNGGWLPPGMSLVVNNTGHPEAILPHDRIGQGQLVINVNGALDSDAVARQVIRLIKDYDSRRGGITLNSRTLAS